MFVGFGAVVSLTGGWLQLHPEGILPRQDEGWQWEPTALAQIRRLGGCFLFMGVFFAMQMGFDLARRPWWIGTLCGLAIAITAVVLVRAQSRRGRVDKHSTLPEKVLEVR